MRLGPGHVLVSYDQFQTMPTIMFEALYYAPIMPGIIESNAES